MDHHQPRFTKDQRRWLDTWGVTAAQIDELESVALPIGRAWLGSPPTLTDVREELRKLSAAMRVARKAMLPLLEEVEQTPAQREAADRVLEVIYEMGGNGEAIKKAFDTVTLIHGAVDNATLKMPQEERRNRAASIIPVRAIDEALFSGYVKEHSAICEKACDVLDLILRARRDEAMGPEFQKKLYSTIRAVDPNNELPVYRFKPSSSPTSDFRRVVGICYGAMNRKHDDPERAIRAYIKALGRHRQTQHDGEDN